MVNYKELYTFLFSQMANAIEALERNKSEEAKNILIFAGYEAENIYIDSAEDVMEA